MKKIFLLLAALLAVVVLALAYVPSNPYDFLQVGNATSETEHNANGFGPVEPTTHPGGWGNIGGEPVPSDHLARVTWANTEADDFEERGATFVMRVPQKCCATTNCPSVCSCYNCDWSKTVANKLKLRVLDGQANDDFIVMWKNGNSWQLLHVYVSDHSTAEYWTTVEVDLSSIPKYMRNRGKSLTFKVVATGNAWAHHATYGQLGIDWAALEN